VRKRPTDLTLLLADSFTTIVWKQDVQVDLYRLDLMHREGLNEQQGLVHGEAEADFARRQRLERQGFQSGGAPAA